jgi:hypothetical protein
MTNVFISYRRDDAAAHAGRLSDRLAARFGAARVFMDVEDIQPGQNFTDAIEQTLARCDHLLAIVGPRWLDAFRARGTDREDFVRREIAVALAGGVTVIPVLVGGARMPDAADLPPDMAAFSRCQAVEIRDNRFDEDAARLIAFLAGRQRSPRGRALALAAAATAVLLVGAAGAWGLWGRPASATPLGGGWTATVQKPGQPSYAVRLTLVQDDERISGVVHYPTGEGTIRDGRLRGGRLTFHTVHVPQFASDPATIRTEAEVDGDALHLSMTDDAGTATGTARRTSPGTAGAAGARARPSLAYGTWTLRGARDEEGKSWTNSVLQFTSQEETADGLLLRGRFTWRLDNVLMGTEEVTGRYVDRTRHVILEGRAVTDAQHPGPERLAAGSYSAVLTEDERALVQGRWGSSAHDQPGFAGEWEAVR